jgi:hypothetical protein
MEHRRTTDGTRGARRWLREPATPLGAVCAYAAVLAAGALWPTFAGAADVAAFVGRAVAGVLALHAVHEAGHVLAGVAVGLPLQSVSLGPLTLLRERRAGRRRGRLICRVNRSWRRFSGCVEREVEPGPGMREALTATALGGPAASLAGGALLLQLASVDWQAVGYASLLIGAINAVPVRLLGQASDGLIVLRLWSRRPGHAAWRAQFCGADGALGR